MVEHGDANWKVLYDAMTHNRQVTFHYIDSKKVEKYRTGFVSELSATHVRILDRDKDGIRDCVLASIISNVVYLYPREFTAPAHRSKVPARKPKNAR